MKLPIHLDIESDSIWTTYRQEREAVTDVESLRKFMERWKEIYIILPSSIFRAMMHAKEYVAPLNCAFIQGNGGIGAFESS